jgi:putative DNA primase/helicase
MGAAMGNRTDRRLAPVQRHTSRRSGTDATAFPMRFKVTSEAVFNIQEGDGKPEYREIRVCARLDVTAHIRDAASNNWGLLLTWKDVDGKKHNWAMPKAMLTRARDVAEHLLAQGLSIEHGMHEELLEYIASCNPEARLRGVNCTGWHDGAFVFADGTAITGSVQGEDIVFQAPGQSLKHSYETSGDTEQWKQHVGELCAGNSRLVFAVSCAFAGPTLKLLAEESGGIHIFGSSSTGKTTAARVGGSVWGGGGRDGFLQSWRSTANGLEITAAIHNDACLFLDEIGQLDPKQAAEIPYQLANGQGKNRMNADGSPRSKLGWRLQYVSTGEITLADHAGSAARIRGGMENRLLNIPADAARGLGVFENIHGAASASEFANQLRDASLRYYGQPSRDWVQCLAAIGQDATERLRELITTFEEAHMPQHATSEVCRAVRRFAVIAAAGEYATFLGLTGWEPGEADRAAAECLRSWLVARGGVNPFDEMNFLRKVQYFLGSHADRFAQLPNPKPTPNRAGFRKQEKGHTTYYILPEVFRSEVCDGYDYRRVCGALKGAGHLETDRDRLDKQMRIEGMGRVRLYAVKDSIFEQ